jgi:hypothetical protein
MNVAELEAALPALAVTILSDDLVAADVLVVDQDETVPPIAKPHAVWRFVEEAPVPEAGGLGRHTHALRYTFSVVSPTASQADRRRWPQEVRAGLHHRLRPFGVDGLDHAEVLAVRVVQDDGVGNPGLAGPARAEFDVAFFGDVLRDDDALALAPDELGVTLALWLDGQDEDTITLVGSKVSAWLDKSPSALSLVQATDGNRPTYGATEWGGVKPGVTFARASSQRLAAAWATLGQTGEVYAVVIPDAMASGERALMAWDGTGSNRLVLYHAINNGAGKSLGLDVHDGAAARQVRGASLIEGSTPQLWSWRSSGTAYAVALDGTDETLAVLSGSNDGAWWSDLASITTVIVGCRNDQAGDFLGGTVGEIVAFAGTLTAAQRTSLLAYFAERWGV